MGSWEYDTVDQAVDSTDTVLLMSK